MSMTHFWAAAVRGSGAAQRPRTDKPITRRSFCEPKIEHDTTPLLALLQPEFDRQIPGAIIDTRTLETGKPVGLPVQVRVSGEDMPRLRAEAEKLKQIFREIPIAARVRDDWGEPSREGSGAGRRGPGKHGARHERRCC